MKLLVVAPYFYPKIGGMENYAWNISKGLKNKYKWDVVVITSNHEKKVYKEEVIEGIKIYRLPILFKISNTPINPKWYFDIKKIIKKEKPDIINAHSPVPFMADICYFAANNIPYALTYHSGSMRKDCILTDIPISIYESTLLKILEQKVNRIISPSTFVVNTLFHKFKYKTAVITPGVDTTIFKPLTKNTRKLTLLFIANHKKMYPLKGLLNIIEAIKDTPDIHLNVVGEKEKSIIPNVHFLGYKNETEMVQEINNADVVLLPSLIDESFGMVLIESMACRKPVIGSRKGGIPEVISENQDGILVNPNNTEEIKQAITKLIYNEKLRDKLGNQGYKKILKYYTWEEKINQTDYLLKNLQ